MVGSVGPPATISREPGQARKGAAAAVTLCAGVWLAGLTSMTPSLQFPSLSSSLITALVSGIRARADSFGGRPATDLQGGQ